MDFHRTLNVKLGTPDRADSYWLKRKTEMIPWCRLKILRSVCMDCELLDNNSIAASTGAHSTRLYPWPSTCPLLCSLQIVQLKHWTLPLCRISTRTWLWKNNRRIRGEKLKMKFDFLEINSDQGIWGNCTYNISFGWKSIGELCK